MRIVTDPFTTLRKILRAILETINIEKMGFYCDGVKCRIADVALDYLWTNFDDPNHHLEMCDFTPVDFFFTTTLKAISMLTK